MLELPGQDVWTAYSGAEGLVLAAAHRPQVVFADVSMPGMTGSELARRLRREFPAGVMTLVAVTGHNSSHPKVLDGDFDRHMLKPVTVDSVAALLGSLARGQDS